MITFFNRRLSRSLLVAPDHEYNHFLKQQVVFVYDVSAGGNALGVILERPTAFSVAEMVPGFDEFDRNVMHTGGEDGGKSVIMLHRHALKGARLVGAGIFVGGVVAAREEIKAGGLTPRDFKFFFNHVSFTRLDLKGMLEVGGWHAARLSDAESVAAVLHSGDSGLWEMMKRIISKSAPS